MGNRYKALLILLSLVMSSQAFAQPVTTPATVQMDQMEAQSRGDYPELNIDYARPLGLQQEAWIDPLRHMGEGQTKPAYSRYYWKPDVVLPVRLREGMVTLINFPEWELIENVFIGDEITFDGQIVATNALLVYPTQPGADTNMIVFAKSGNRYAFYLRSETYNTERITNSVIDIEVVDTYKKKSSGGGAKVKGGSFKKASAGGVSPLSPVDSTYTSSIASDDKWVESVPLDPTKFRFDVDIFVPNPKDTVIAPERVWRDNVFTYIDFGQKAINMYQRPVASLIQDDVETPVGFRTEGPYGRMMIVEAIGDIVLRSGLRVVCLKLQRDYDVAMDMSGVKMPGWSPAKGNAPGSKWATSPFASNGQQDARIVNNSGSEAIPLDTIQSNSYDQMMSPSKKQRFAGELALELGSANNVKDLEQKWDQYVSNNKDVLGGYSPYYALDAAASGAGDPTFRLRVGPVDGVLTGDDMCRKLGERGISCVVVRTQ